MSVRMNLWKISRRPIEAVPKEPTGEEWTEEDQTILDSEEDDDGDENDNEPKKIKISLFSKTKMYLLPGKSITPNYYT